MDALKYKAIDEYKKFLTLIERGYSPDYYDLMNLINFISVYYSLESPEFLKQQLLNQNATPYLHFCQ